jgi:hypothetical protein
VQLGNFNCAVPAGQDFDAIFVGIHAGKLPEPSQKVT